MNARTLQPTCLMVLLLPLLVTAGCTDDWEETATLSADRVMVFNGLPSMHGWGEKLVFQVDEDWEEEWTYGNPPLGGIPLVDVYSSDGGVAMFNLATEFEPFTVRLEMNEGEVTIMARGGSKIVAYQHDGDYYQPLREFATQMERHGLGTQPAPDWAFEPIWETYGFEESWDVQTVQDMLPVLSTLQVGSVTLDSGWFGQGSGEQWEAMSGDFLPNPEVVGSQAGLTGLIDDLHTAGLKVRLWWVPGVFEKETDLYDEHPDWLYSKVTPSWGEPDDTGDWYLDPTLPEVLIYNRELVTRLVGYGADGFKQDDVFLIDSDDPEVHAGYRQLFTDSYDTALAIKPDFAINTCNCGLAQHFFVFNGENMLITSDPVDARQVRLRGKYLTALNLGGAAILGDHVELTQGDVGMSSLLEPGFYDQLCDADFASTVALGMVLQTKLNLIPGGPPYPAWFERYRDWFALYREYGFYDMEWINVPYFAWDSVETYLLQDEDKLYFTFFTPDDTGRYQGPVDLSHLTPGTTYEAWDLIDDSFLGIVDADDDSAQLEVDFEGCLMVSLAPE